MATVSASIQSRPVAGAELASLPLPRIDALVVCVAPLVDAAGGYGVDAMRRLVVVVVGAVLVACEPAPSNQAAGRHAVSGSAASAASAATMRVERDAFGQPKSYSVVAYGYNYTDTYIDSFEVDGAGGGNLEVSIPNAGGGGHTCCALVTSGLPLGTTFNIKWTRDRQRYCQQDVALTGPVPSEPRYLEVHFYPDGKIEIEVTQQASPPRLKLDRVSYARRKETGNVDNDEKYSRCKDGYR